MLAISYQNIFNARCILSGERHATVQPPTQIPMRPPRIPPSIHPQRKIKQFHLQDIWNLLQNVYLCNSCGMIKVKHSTWVSKPVQNCPTDGTEWLSDKTALLHSKDVIRFGFSSWQIVLLLFFKWEWYYGWLARNTARCLLMCEKMSQNTTSPLKLYRALMPSWPKSILTTQRPRQRLAAVISPLQPFVVNTVSRLETFPLASRDERVTVAACRKADGVWVCSLMRSCAKAWA